MKNAWIFAVQISFFGFAPTAYCQALEETTSLLSDPVARDKAVQGDPSAMAATQKVKDLGLSSGDEQKLYDLSGKIFEKLTQDSGGDTNTLNSKVQDLMRNPADLEKSLSSEQKQQIRDLSKGVESRQSN